MSYPTFKVGEGRDADNKVYMRVIPSSKTFDEMYSYLQTHGCEEFRKKFPVLCSGCHETIKNPKYCNGCKRVAYCSKECQRYAWKIGGHRDVCKKDNHEAQWAKCSQLCYTYYYKEMDQACDMFIGFTEREQRNFSMRVLLSQYLG